ncbi:DUF484 family protein [Aliidiomarina halalkaliphila]|nr:DUF484 family protein [Aliidiomarina halalkaliphila]
MSKDKVLATELDTTQLDADMVADFLRANPDFFEHYPNVLVRMNLRHQQEGSVSLMERQQRALREKVTSLEDEITALMTQARRNEQIFKGYSVLYRKLLKCDSLDAVIDHLQDTFRDQLALPELSLKFFDSPVALPEQFTFSADTHKQLLSRRFEEEKVYLGRLPKDELKLLFREEEHIQSVALVLLGQDGELGMLAVGSKDPLHFDPTMDYLLITQLQDVLAVVLPRVLGAHRSPE